jgi:RNA polymerase sigma-70 factor (ECF subfamily)
MTGIGPADIERVFRAESGRAVASLIRLLGDISLAEEAVPDAFVAALPPSCTWCSTRATSPGDDLVRA